MSEERRERRSYYIGAALSLLLTVLAFGAVLSIGLTHLPVGATVTVGSTTVSFDTLINGPGRTAALWIIGFAAVLQILAQLRFFLHIDLSRQKREDLQLILFSLLLLSIMAGGTIWIMGDLSQRMM
jgi:cytochrome o ubiquinol oxidase operon protein cyoD